VRKVAPDLLLDVNLGGFKGRRNRCTPGSGHLVCGYFKSSVRMFPQLGGRCPWNKTGGIAPFVRKYSRSVSHVGVGRDGVLTCSYNALTLARYRSKRVFKRLSSFSCNSIVMNKSVGIVYIVSRASNALHSQEDLLDFSHYGRGPRQETARLTWCFAVHRLRR
jgi:hypothetical protein